MYVVGTARVSPIRVFDMTALNTYFGPIQSVVSKAIACALHTNNTSVLNAIFTRQQLQVARDQLAQYDVYVSSDAHHNRYQSDAAAVS